MGPDMGRKKKKDSEKEEKSAMNTLIEMGKLYIINDS